MRIGLFLLVFSLALQVSATSGAPDDKVVVPGVRVGKWTLIMTLDDLLRTNG